MSNDTRPGYDQEEVESAFADSKSEAEETVKDKKRTKRVLDDAMRKAERLQGPLEKVWDRLMLMIGVVKAWLSGEYKEIPIGSIIAIVAALLYLLCPVDGLPDFIPVIGYLDDVFVIGLVFAQVYADLEKFKRWRDERDQREVCA